MDTVNVLLECLSQEEFVTYVVRWQAVWTVTMQDAQYVIQCLVFIWTVLYVLVIMAFHQPNESMLKMHDARMFKLSQSRPLYLMRHILILPGH